MEEYIAVRAGERLVLENGRLELSLAIVQRADLTVPEFVAFMEAIYGLSLGVSWIHKAADKTYIESTQL